MSLYWIAHRIDDQPRVFIAEASWPIYARLAAAFATFPGSFVEIHTLDAKTAKRVPASAVGKALGPAEARAFAGAHRVTKRQ